MSDKFEEFAQDVKQLAYELRAGLCPVWTCGGVLEHIERINWQEPDLKCTDCGAKWKLINRPLTYSSLLSDNDKKRDKQ